MNAYHPASTSKYHHRFGLLIFLLGIGSVSATAAPPFAIGVAQRDLVTQSVDTTQHFVLPGHRAAWAGIQNDVGAVPSDLLLSHLTITLNRSPERQVAFEQLLKDQQNPSSPQFHHWLTPVEVGTQFGASQHDIDAVSGWLKAQGLHIDNISNSLTRLTFSGSADAIGTTFATSIHFYQVGTEKRIANTDDPQIPAALSDSVLAVSGLYSVKYRPASHLSQRQGSVTPSHPAGTYCPQGSSTCTYSVFPADFAKIYDLDGVPSNITGSGQTIAILGKARVSNADLQNYQKIAGVTFANPTVIVPTSLGGVDPGDPATSCTASGATNTCSNPSDAVQNQSEATLDVERAGSVAPGAALTLIVSSDTVSGSNTVDAINYTLEYALDNNPVPANIISISFAGCEASDGASTIQFLDQQYQQAAAEGISIFAAAGDSGVAGCESSFKTPTSGQVAGISDLCSSGAATCVGGTEFADTSNPSAYWSATETSNFLSALGYIPEGAWNEPLDGSGNPTVAGTGGGISAFVATPSWQTGPGVPGKQGRYVPDVSFTAASHDAYFGCMAATGGPCSIDPTTGGFTFAGFAGTSASTPSMAGVAALINQQAGSAQGNLNPRLYELAAQSGSNAFHDVTVSSSGVANCTASVPSLCNNSTAGPTGLTGGVAGYLVGTGYDLATGLGSLDIANLLAQWGGGGGGSAAFNPNQFGLTGSWFDPQTSGQGVILTIYPDLSSAGHGGVFGGWYTFDVTAAGGQRWYTVQGSVLNTSASTPSLDIFTTVGGNFAAPPIVGATKTGSGILTFADCTHATLDYTFNDGRTGSIPLQRGTSNVTCGSSGDSGSNASTNYLLSGAWLDPNTSGQGLVIEVNPLMNLLFAGWYTYAPNGETIGGGASQRWYTLQSNTFAAGSVAQTNIAVYDTTGGTFNTPGGIIFPLPQVGTADINFTSCDTLTLSYRFTSGDNAGKSGTLNLTQTGLFSHACLVWYPTH